MKKHLAIDGQNVILVAHEPPGSEHLGIRMVAAALAEAGFRPRVLSLLSPLALAAIVSETLAARPLLVGVSISDPLVAPLMFAFARLLRQEGFAGHLTAGGALATLQRSEILADHAAIDSVVRHAGEVAIAELARALTAGAFLADVPGLTTRTSEGRGNPQAFSPSRLRPMRAEDLPTVIGIPKAEIAASRGCAGQCAYCGVSALARDLASERQRLGLPGSHVRGNLRRSIDDVADEVADLYHQRGVRIGHFVDDNLLGPDPVVAREWLGDFERALSRRRVGKMAWRLMMEPRAITDDVADLLARLGFLSVLVGFESLTRRGLSTLGRAGTPQASLVAVQRLASRGIAPVINVLALRPEGNLADARAEIVALDRVENYAWDVIPLTVWPGTQLAQDLSARGQLVGRGAGMAWRPDEPAAERFLFALDRLRVGGLAWLLRQPNSVEASFALRAAQWLGLPGATRAHVDRADAWLVTVQRARQGFLAQALDIAESPLSPSEFGQSIESLAQQMNRRLAPLDRDLADLLDSIEWPATGDPGKETAALPSRRLASRWLAGTVYLAITAGCTRTTLSVGAKDAAPSAVSDTAVPSDSITTSDGPTVSSPDVANDRLVFPDAQPDTSSDLLQVADAVPSADDARSDSSDAVCDAAALANFVENAIGGTCQPTNAPAQASYAVLVDVQGRAVELMDLYNKRPALTGSVRQAWLDSMANIRWPCLAGQPVYFSCMFLLY